MNSFKINETEYIIDNTIENNSFVGIKVINNKYHLYFPIGYKIKDDSNEKDYKKILRYLYKTVIITKTVEHDLDYSYEKEKENIIPMNSYLSILSDYYSNGIYKYNEKKFINDVRGKINWKRTFKNGFYIVNEKPLYTNTVIEYNKKETNIITQLQLYCINKAIDMLTFLGDFNKPFSSIKKEDIDKNIKQYNLILDKELRNTNNDKKKILLENIKSIINDCNNSENKIRTFGTLNYHVSFEKMIDKLFGSEKNLKEFYPNATWKLVNNPKEFESTKLREDTIYKNDKEIYIIDSKYYRYGVMDYDQNLLPNTSSIHKQIVYGEYVKNKFPNYKVYNCFIIPSDINEFIDYKGYAKMKLSEIDKEEEYKYVYLCFINMNQVIDYYFEKKNNHIKELIEVLEKNIINEKKD